MHLEPPYQNEHDIISVKISARDFFAAPLQGRTFFAPRAPRAPAPVPTLSIDARLEARVLRRICRPQPGFVDCGLCESDLSGRDKSCDLKQQLPAAGAPIRGERHSV